MLTFLTGLVSSVLLLFLYIFVIPILFEFVRLRGLHQESLKHSEAVCTRCRQAYQNVWLRLYSRTDQRWSAETLRKITAIYYRVDELSASAIKAKLIEKDVLNELRPWRWLGRTLEEGVMVVIYTSRLDKETAAFEATKQEHEALLMQARVAANVQQRKEIERQKDAVASELTKPRTEFARPPIATQDEAEETGLERY